MTKAVAAAMVLIAGAAVVLWFGNTLNSWVLGGLIGGLAALLLSVPISLTLFSYLSRRHDEQLRAEAELAETEFSEVYGAYAETPARTLRGTYDAEGYALQEGTEEFWDEEEEYYHPQRALPRPTARNLPVPVPQRLIEQSPVINRLPANQQGTRAPLPRPATRNVPAARGKDGTGRRTTRNMNNYPGFPGYEPGSMMRHHKSAALRAARLEKARQYDDDVEVLPSPISRRVPSLRAERDLTGQYERMPRQRSTRQLPPQQQMSPVQKRRRIVESTPSRNDLSQLLPDEGESTARQSPDWEDPETENLFNNPYPHTEPMRRSTGQIGRNPYLDGRQEQNENPSGSLKKPLVRRAPYMYEDDPLRQELSQQLNPPLVRRSSRLEAQQHEEE